MNATVSETSSWDARRSAGSVLIVVLWACLGLVAITLTFGHSLGWKPLERTRINARVITIMSCRPVLTELAFRSET